jgi:hypothetical protein
VNKFFFRIELDPGILRIPRNCPRLINTGIPFSTESNRETGTNESLADDNTILSLINTDSLSCIRDILDNFAEISGLHCNFDKTSILAMNEPTVEELQSINQSGFTLVTKLKLLGAEITNNCSDLKNNFTIVIEKVKNLISYWSRFKLSLPGRISVAKTFLLSQINYLGSIFLPDPDQLRCLQTMINTFIKKNLNISDTRIYLPPSSGGLGFFNLENFLIAQHCTWIFKAIKLPIDNWRYDLHFLSPNNNPLFIRECDVDKNVHPILHQFVLSFCKFIGCFSNINSNYKESIIFHNNVFRDPLTGTTLRPEFFGLHFYLNYRNSIRSLKFSDCINENNFKTVQEFRDSGLPMSQNLWFKLRSALLNTKTSNTTNTGSTTTLSDFIRNWKKGCKSVRKILEVDLVHLNPPLSSKSFITFSRLIDCVPDLEWPMNQWFSTWNIHSLPNDFRHFIFCCLLAH